jgi:diketogulonate reductase-like aldo/keto reductase
MEENPEEVICTAIKNGYRLIDGASLLASIRF